VIGRLGSSPCAVQVFLPFTVPDHRQIQRAGLVVYDRWRGQVDE
jgi:hypothetical protein